MGFDNTEVAHLLDLTTIDYPVVQQAENAFSILQNRWNNTNNGLNTLSYKLVERKSLNAISLLAALLLVLSYVVSCNLNKKNTSSKSMDDVSFFGTY
ncbi:hypothetical protein HPL003_18850 [Paenibacillus terrae HPL-003]|uniref:Uncharacterized protein n=2 Tax=Paenibacillus terrae TaxID=159743 RepID=G7W123_PAETH|nr:hypothetical protein HPL003_18850 [Paenibacillus terrae HPL-003]